MQTITPNSYLNMDCMDGMRQFPDKYFDLAIVDPPYGLGEHGGKNRNGYVKQKSGSRTYVPDGGYEKKDWDNEPPGADYFNELIRVSKNQIIFGCNYFDFPLRGGESYGINAMTVRTNPVRRLHTAP